MSNFTVFNHAPPAGFLIRLREKYPSIISIPPLYPSPVSIKIVPDGNHKQSVIKMNDQEDL